MRRRLFGRRAVGAMIGGIIILIIFLTALVFIFAMSEQYDAYQSILATTQEKQIEMYSENILPSYPGLTNGTGTLSGNTYQVSCAGGSVCNNYTVLVNNLGITAQVVRIYIYQAGSGSSCNPCIFDPAKAATPNMFWMGDEVINAGEYAHNLVFWLPSLTSLSSCTTTAGCRVTLATARGRTFSFIYPFPLSTLGSGAHSGGTGLYLGPLVIRFQKELITYTNSTDTVPSIPVGGPDGAWSLPSNTYIVIYIKIQTDINVPNNVYLTPQTVFQIAQFTSPGVVNVFYIVAPITPKFCPQFIQPGYNTDLNCGLSTYYSTGNTGSVNPIAPYAACPSYTPATYAACANRYVIPKPTQPGQRGAPVIVAFSVSGPTLGVPPPGQAGKISNSWSGGAVTSYLGLSYVYDDGSGPYLYGVTFPFISLCIDTCSI